MADMLFSAATDHRYIQDGHVLDFTNNLSTTWDGVNTRIWNDLLPFTWAQVANQPWNP